MYLTLPKQKHHFSQKAQGIPAYIFHDAVAAVSADNPVPAHQVNAHGAFSTVPEYSDVWHEEPVPDLLRQAQLQIHYKNDPARLAREFAALRAKQYDEYWDTDEFEITVPYPHTAIADGLKKLQQQRMQARKAHKHGDVFYFTEAIKELKQEMQPYSKLRTVANN